MPQRLTKLELVQSILNAMDSDYVTSTTETEEAQQVEQILEEVYYEMLTRTDWDFITDIRKLEASGSATPTDTPTTLRVPDKIADIKNLQYDITVTGDANTTIRTLTYMEPVDFLKMLQDRKSGDSNVVAKNHITTGISLLLRNDKMPEYWTSFEDEYVVFDSYLASEESYVVYTKSIVTGVLYPDWPATDGLYPELPTQFYPTFLARAKARCMVLLKQMQSPHDEQESRAGMSRLKRLGSKTNDQITKPNYGRPSTRTTRRSRWN
jgi:hypothetical protein